MGKAIIALEDGRTFEGHAFGASGETFGEIVFNTSMTGYQEILTDPSYEGQIVTMTYPLIGNYGVNGEDFESRRPFVRGFVVKERSRMVSNWRATESLEDFLSRYNIIGVEGVDTRAITKHIRLAGAMKAVISTEDLDRESLVEKARSSPGIVGIDLVKGVTCDSPYRWDEPADYGWWRNDGGAGTATLRGSGRHRVVVLDCGVKYNILRLLRTFAEEVIVVPAGSSPEEILSYDPDGVLLSNGPGDPAAVPYVVETVRELLGKRPIFGICLGHQMIGLALGGRTYKLKFGHHGGNHPVMDLKTGKVYITVQNHGFCVDIGSLDGGDVEMTHINLNDRTLEGMRHMKIPVMSVQYHPEAGPGPHDSSYLFEEFTRLMDSFRS